VAQLAQRASVSDGPQYAPGRANRTHPRRCRWRTRRESANAGAGYLV